MSADGSSRARAANRATSAKLSQYLTPPTDANWTLSVKTGLELHDDLRNDIWAIFEENMIDLYRASSFEWNPPEKRQELFHQLSRFILVHGPDGRLTGFCDFRFEHEDEEDLVYCYELQISKAVQRKGLGKTLVDRLVSIGKGFFMEKIVLTCFNSNVDALAFYKRYGFATDPSSPDEEDDEECDYTILCIEIE
ncbi:acyl-CoA N-acyltransferase [Mycena floridula]|nr:acyl-CoA N-acyltransferase [Mycena floridula]